MRKFDLLEAIYRHLPERNRAEFEREADAFFEGKVYIPSPAALCKKDLKRHSMHCAFAFILMVALSYVIGAIARDLGLAPLLRESSLFYNGYSILVSILVFLPFLLVYYLSNETDRAAICCFDFPKSKKFTALCVGAGFFICMIANEISAVLISLGEKAGAEFYSPDFGSEPTNGAEYFVYFISLAVAPAILEELVVRCAIMQPLRRFGDTFAIVVSAILFGLMHGNLRQAPFAFVCGLALGYAVWLTGSVWTGVLIHFLNNAWSAILTFLQGTSEGVIVNVYSVVQTLAFLVGIACILILILSKDRPRPVRRQTVIHPVKLGARFFFGNIFMCIVVFYYLYKFVQYSNLSLFGR